MAETQNTAAAESRIDNDQMRAIIGLAINALLFPGLGSIIGGKTRTGIMQLALLIISIPLMFVFIGFITAFAAWVWGIVTGIRMLQETNLI